MNIIALILLIIAAVFFAVACTNRPVPSWLLSAGLALLTIGLIVQFAAKTHSITF